MTNYKFDRSKQCVSNIMIQVDFLQKKNVDSSPYDSDLMAKDFIQHFNNQAFSVDQQVTPVYSHWAWGDLVVVCSSPKPHLAPLPLVILQLAFSFSDKLFALVVKDMEAMDPSILRGEKPSSKKQKVFISWRGYFSSTAIAVFFVLFCLVNRAQIVYLAFSPVADQTLLIVTDGFCCFSQIATGLLLANSQVIFEKAENSPLNLIGECLQHTSEIAGRHRDCCLLILSDDNDEKWDAVTGHRRPQFSTNPQGGGISIFSLPKGLEPLHWGLNVIHST